MLLASVVVAEKSQKLPASSGSVVNWMVARMSLLTLPSAGEFQRPLLTEANVIPGGSAAKACGKRSITVKLGTRVFALLVLALML